MITCSASDHQGSNFEFCVRRAVSSHSSHQPQEVLLSQLSLYMHKGGLKHYSFHLCWNLSDRRNEHHITFAGQQYDMKRTLRTPKDPLKCHPFLVRWSYAVKCDKGFMTESVYIIMFWLSAVLCFVIISFFVRFRHTVTPFSFLLSLQGWDCDSKKSGQTLFGICLRTNPTWHMSPDTPYLAYVSEYPLFGICLRANPTWHMSIRTHPTWHMSPDTPHLAYVSGHTLLGICHQTHPTWHMSPDTPYLAYVSGHTLLGICFRTPPNWHMSPDTPYLAYVSGHTLLGISLRTHLTWHMSQDTPYLA